MAFTRAVYSKPLINSQRIPPGREKPSGKRDYWELTHKKNQIIPAKRSKGSPGGFLECPLESFVPAAARASGSLPAAAPTTPPLGQFGGLGAVSAAVCGVRGAPAPGRGTGVQLCPCNALLPALGARGPRITRVTRVTHPAVSATSTHRLCVCTHRGPCVSPPTCVHVCA